jgi:RNA polymerase sigma-70 factor, ECF subfamily
LDRRSEDFESVLWPNLRAAYNFARWLVRNDHDAEDIVQESFAKAYQAMDNFRGGDARVWLLAIVRNTTMNFLGRRGHAGREVGWSDGIQEPADLAPDPERELIQRSRRERVRSAIECLPPELRETLILREIEDLSYREIASVLKVPVGTVMSRLCRARNLLARELVGEKGGGL